MAQRLCQVATVYQDNFNNVFKQQYETIHRLEINKIRNSAKFYAHLLYTDSLDWSCISVIKLTEEDTTSQSRIFVKILMQEIAENLGILPFAKKLNEEKMIKSHIAGIFPKNSIENARFSINFFTSIGLGGLTEDLREFLKDAPKILLE